MGNENLIKIFKITGFNIMIALANIIFFSPGIFSFKLTGGGSFEKAVSLFVIIISVAVFIYGNKKLLIDTPKKIQTYEINNTDEFVEALKQYSHMKTFQKDIDAVVIQINRILKKKEMIHQALLQNFGYKKTNYKIMEVTIATVEQLFDIFSLNVKDIINKLYTFDETEYLRIKKMNDDVKSRSELSNAQIQIYYDYINVIMNLIEKNEKILFEFDKLFLEISKLGNAPDLEQNKEDAINEFQRVIREIKSNST